MNKRQAMKSLYIAQECLSGASKLLGAPRAVYVPAYALYAMRIESIRQCPASVFRKDKPAVDKRRFKRWQNKNKGSAILSELTSTS